VRRSPLGALRRAWPALACLCLGACGNAPSPETLAEGQAVYEQYCLTCHQASGRGVPGMAPSLVKSDWVAGDEERLIRVVLEGLEGPITVSGESFEGVMGAQAYLTDEQVAAVLTWLRQSFENHAPPVDPGRVAELRAAPRKP